MSREKTIVCFGDSNTYGRRAQGGRFDWNTRYPGVLSALLGRRYHVIEEGCGGRTTVFQDPIEGHKCGADYLPPCLWSHRPIDLVVVMLGTNDTKNRFSASAQDITGGMERLLRLISTSRCGVHEQAPQILLLAPIQMGELSALANHFIGAREKAAQLPRLFQELAQANSIAFLDAGAYAQPDAADGVHMTAKGHHDLAVAIHQKVVEILEDN